MSKEFWKEGKGRDEDRAKRVTTELWKALYAKESLLAQKARTKWIEEGDGIQGSSTIP